MATAKKKSSPVKKKVVVKQKKKVIKKAVAKSKSKKVAAIPKGYHSITPCLIVSHAAKAIEFYKKAFDAKELMRMERPGGKIAHAELKMGDAKIMLSDACPEMHTQTPEVIGGTPVCIHLYIKDVDSVVKRAVKAGAQLIRAVEDQFYGDRSGTLQDPHGHIWVVSTHVENVTSAQIKKRATELFGKNN